MEIEALGWVITLEPGEILGPGMFLALVVALLSGYPVAFGLGGSPWCSPRWPWPLA